MGFTPLLTFKEVSSFAQEGIFKIAQIHSFKDLHPKKFLCIQTSEVGA